MYRESNNAIIKKAHESEGITHTPSPESPRQDGIVFKSPGLAPDFEILVFDQPFHVHLTILKLHSNYFRRFLDSPEESSNVAEWGFKYTSHTVVDDCGIWGLDPGSKVRFSRFVWVCCADFYAITYESARLDEWDVIKDQTAFESLLCAMYNRPYSIRDVLDLQNLTKLADFYCALPIVSATLTGALMSGGILDGGQTNTDLAHRCGNIILVAKKLRHALEMEPSPILRLCKLRR